MPTILMPHGPYRETGHTDTYVPPTDLLLAYVDSNAGPYLWVIDVSHDGGPGIGCDVVAAVERGTPSAEVVALKLRRMI